MFLPHDHQKEQITGADPHKTLTDGDTTCDPRRQGANLHGASPLCSHSGSHSDVYRGEYCRGNPARCPTTLKKDAMCVIKGIASLGSKNVGDPHGSTAR